MLFREITGMYYDNNVTHIHRVNDKMQGFIILQEVVCLASTVLLGS